MVIMEETWNAAWWNAINRDGNRLLILMVMSRMAMATTARYPLSSSHRPASLGLRMSSR